MSTSVPGNGPNRLQTLPPSAKLVFKVLEHEGALTQAEIADSTLLPSRTSRHALALLQDDHLVTARNSFRDARQRIYTLAEQ